MPSGTASAKGFGDFHRVALGVTAPKTGFRLVRSWANLLMTAAHWNLTHFMDTFNQIPLTLLFYLLTNVIFLERNESVSQVFGPCLVDSLCVHPCYRLISFFLTSFSCPHQENEWTGQWGLPMHTQQACLKHAASCVLSLSHSHSVKKRCGAAGKINTPCLQQRLLVVM